MFRRFATVSGVALGVGGAVWANGAVGDRRATKQRAAHLAATSATNTPPTREQTIAQLRDEEGINFDILVIGGGATGCAAALDASSRGLRTALLERNDFASATSARSTKLIHGGVRYLELAFKSFDWHQLSLVAHALRERKQFVDAAPHLCAPLPTAVPCYSYFDLAYIYAGLLMYDLIAGRETLARCRLLSAPALLRTMPTLAANGLCGGVVYYDGQTNDARMNLELALTAAAAGAAVANHVEVRSLLKDAAGRVVGVRAVDTLDPAAREFDVRARVVINATGPAGDELRQLESPGAARLLRPSAGTHIVLPSYYCSSTTGLLVPKTPDGRVLFMLPWEGATVIGTTERPLTTAEAASVDGVGATAGEVDFVLETLRPFLGVEVRRDDVLAAWAGVRPLCVDPHSLSEADGKTTAKLSRDHVVHVGPGGMVSVMGGKWTTWRLMGEDAVNRAVQVGDLASKAKPCATHNALVVGARFWHPALEIDLVRHFGAIDLATARHLAHTYGGNAVHVARLVAARPELGARLSDAHPFIGAEVVYGARHEHARTVEDVISRRMPMALLDARAAERAVERVTRLLGDELGWSAQQRAHEGEHAHRYLQRCLLPPALSR
jgi:glycerol-3-phosphate dehydrogenase